MIEQVAVGDTETLSVAYAPWPIGDVNEISRTLAAADAGTARAATSSRPRKKRAPTALFRVTCLYLFYSLRRPTAMGLRRVDKHNRAKQGGRHRSRLLCAGAAVLERPWETGRRWLGG